MIIEYLVAPTKLIGESGSLTTIGCTRMKLGEFDRTGRRKPIPIEGSEFTLPVDVVIPAISQSADTSFIAPDAGIKVTKTGTFECAPRTRTRSTADGIFVCGDAVSGPATVVEAIIMGRQALHDVESPYAPRTTRSPTRSLLKRRSRSPLRWMRRWWSSPKRQMPELKTSERERNFKEVELGYSEGDRLQRGLPVPALRCRGWAVSEEGS